ncbi:MAG: DNA-deoxyinosine glycosylase [Pseudomonadota bacterium]|nr:DNA-deoxyinosine glycosylase [Pseudomonadota bacterium]
MTRSFDAGPGDAPLLEGLPPVVGERTTVLVLGSFPSARSLAARQYYAHPQNQFWKILQAIWPARPLPTGADSYQKRSEWLLERGLGLWDVYARCRRAGSLDAAIRDAEVNDIAALNLPQLSAIVHNGGESFRHAGAVAAHLSAPSGGSEDTPGPGVGVRFYRLPSTSPANASWSFERKLDAWRTVMSAHGLA